MQASHYTIIYMIGLLGMSLIHYRASLDWVERVMATTRDHSQPRGDHSRHKHHPNLIYAAHLRPYKTMQEGQIYCQNYPGNVNHAYVSRSLLLVTCELMLC